MNKQQLVIQIQKAPPQSEERQKAIVTLADKILSSCGLFPFPPKSLYGVYLDIHQALQQQLYRDIGQNIDEYQLKKIAIKVWEKEVRSRTLKKVINEAYLQQLALELQKYYPPTEEWQYSFQTLANAILLSDKLLHKANIYSDVYEDAENELWLWLYRNINTYNPEKGKFIAWLNFRFDMILRNSQGNKNDPLIQKFHGKIIRRKYQLAKLIKSISQEDLILWLILRIKKILTDVLSLQIFLLLTVLFLLSQLIIQQPLVADSILFEIAKKTLPNATKLANIDDEIENIPQPELEQPLSEQLRAYLETDPNNLLQKHIRAHPEATFQVIALKRLEGISWKELSETFNIQIPALSNFFQRHLQKIAPEIKRYIQEEVQN